MFTKVIGDLSALFSVALLPNSARQFRMRYYQSFGAGSNHGEASAGSRWSAAV